MKKFNRIKQVLWKGAHLLPFKSASSVFVVLINWNHQVLVIFRWFSWSAMYLCSGNLACLASLIWCHIHSRLCAAWPRSCSSVMYGRLIQYSFSASCSSRLIILLFICQVTSRGRRCFPIHCFPGIPFRKSANVKNILEPSMDCEKIL